MIKRSANCIAQSNQMLCCEFHCPNKNKQQHLHVPQPMGTTPLTLRHTRAHTHSKHIQPTYTLEGVRACGEAVPGRHSRLRQSDTSARPEVTCKGTTTIKYQTSIRHTSKIVSTSTYCSDRRYFCRFLLFIAYLSQSGLQNL